MFFWRKKADVPKEPAPSLSDASKRLDESLEEITKKINACDEDLLAYKRNPAAGSKQRALQVLKRKKMLENQRDSLYSTLGVVEETSHSISAMETLTVSVNAMRAAVQTSSKLTLPNIDEVEDLMEEMEEFVEQQREITDIFNANSQVVDEAELVVALLDGVAQLENVGLAVDGAVVDGTPGFHREGLADLERPTAGDVEVAAGLLPRADDLLRLCPVAAARH